MGAKLGCNPDLRIVITNLESINKEVNKVL